MSLIKNHKWIATLALTLLISLGICIFCIYSLAKVSGSAPDTGSGMRQWGSEGASFRSGEREAYFRGTGTDRKPLDSRADGRAVCGARRAQAIPVRKMAPGKHKTAAQIVACGVERQKVLRMQRKAVHRTRQAAARIAPRKDKTAAN
ncbi:hypothetical protein [Paenibacillus zanthoxyli]|uniref:hypothetical protein n=1 Tax=Paenibacillus zanthoxyli TaxID=369399 RepID=UPI000470F7C6|nr:hypothetical protein [Paenibacillus zanthoxyli]